MEKPKYHTANRKPVKVTPEIMNAIEECLEVNRKNVKVADISSK